MINAGLVGGTGYTGVELLRLLLQHPDVALRTVTSRAEAGTPLSEHFPSLRGRTDLAFADPGHAPLGECDLIFFATPNGTAMTMVPALLEAGARIVDLAADFRLRSPAAWERWYGEPHACPELLAEAVYGLPELYRARIADAALVANPGCYPTAVVLGLLPLLEAEPTAGPVIADVKSGVSGAGRSPSLRTLYSEAADNLRAYGVGGHRHLPEILQSLGDVAAREPELVFVPHLVPMVRGILATLYVPLEGDGRDLQGLIEQRYAGEPFVDVMPAGSQPDTRSVRGSNTCRLALHRPGDGRTAVVLSVIDNLAKGAAGQAVQNMNLMFGLAEDRGLESLAVVP